jgi:hypothetical protein
MAVPPRQDLGAPPPPPPDRTPVALGRGFAIWTLAGASLCQLLLVLVGFIAIGLNGASGWELPAFLLIGIGGLAALVFLEIAVLTRRVAARVAWLAIAVVVLDIGAVTLMSTGALAGPCSDAELAIVAEIPAYAGSGAVWEHESSSGACAAQLEVEASADDVLSYYERELERDGWTVHIQDVPTEAPEGEQVEVRELSASREEAVFTIALESSAGHTSAAIRVNA